MESFLKKGKKVELGNTLFLVSVYLFSRYESMCPLYTIFISDIWIFKLKWTRTFLEMYSFYQSLYKRDISIAPSLPADPCLPSILS